MLKSDHWWPSFRLCCGDSVPIDIGFMTPLDADTLESSGVSSAVLSFVWRKQNSPQLLRCVHFCVIDSRQTQVRLSSVINFDARKQTIDKELLRLWIEELWTLKMPEAESTQMTEWRGFSSFLFCTLVYVRRKGRISKFALLSSILDERFVLWRSGRSDCGRVPFQMRPRLENLYGQWIYWSRYKFLTFVAKFAL